ncbi:radical SAM protein [Methanoculleus chikugoensis]|uniref:radical SAM protein n=1 Tax=Methanoculleus chikugoensis TaxID=118126 RepID=UPI001FB5512F|nr:radical SAM protein [Methanoculleus chikugoensis]
MIRFTRLVHGEGPVSGRAASQSALALAESRSGPVVFWNVTSRCNLACTHCYLRSGPGRRREDELTTDEATALIDDLARAGVPLLLFSGGGEPLVRGGLLDPRGPRSPTRPPCGPEHERDPHHPPGGRSKAPGCRDRVCRDIPRRGGDGGDP